MDPVIEPSKFSIWKRLLRKTTTVYKATNILRKRDTRNSQNEAQNYLIKISQQSSFRKAIIIMQTGQQMERRDSVLQFNPFLDGNVVLRAKGRLRHAPIPWNQKHPIILDIKDHVTQLIVQDAHTNSCQHMGTEFAPTTDIFNHWTSKVPKKPQPDMFHMPPMEISEYYTNDV